jgi:hypothetical protein
MLTARSCGLITADSRQRLVQHQPQRQKPHVGQTRRPMTTDYSCDFVLDGKVAVHMLSTVTGNGHRSRAPHPREANRHHR